jgi:hypothetical protein
MGRQGKYVRTNRQHPTGIAKCDRSGLIVNHKDLCKQMEYSGAGLYWTGLWVYKKFIDKPNPQNLAPRVKIDPVPLEHARPSWMVAQEQPNPINIDVSNGNEVDLSNGRTGYNPLVFYGTPSSAVSVRFPVCIGNWVLTNNTSQAINISFLGPISVTNPISTIDASTTASVVANMQSLTSQQLTP